MSGRSGEARMGWWWAEGNVSQPDWSARPLRERGALLLELAGALEAEKGEFARLLTQQQGKPLQQARDEIARSIATIRYFAALDLPLEVLKEDATQKAVRQHKPPGVVAA